MKKNTMMRIASVLLIAVLMTTCVISGTFAKYISTAEATDSARVAKWAFSVDGAAIDLTTDKSFTFNLFNTVNEDDESVAETDVKVGSGEVIIAPGTSGTATVELQNKSEVNATYAVAFTANEAGVPLQWSVDGTTWKDNISDLNIAATVIAMDDGADDGADEKAITLHWKWAYEDDEVVTQSDTDDTTLGIAGTAEVSFTATVTITQVN